MKQLSTNLYQRVTNFTFAIALVLSSLTAAVAPFILSQSAGAVAAPYSEGFEYGSTDWTNTVIASNGADGITASEGSKFGQAKFNAFTRWGSQYRSEFPAGGYDTQLDLFFDPSWTVGNPGQFDFSSAINDKTGTHRRDFIFTFGSNGNDGLWHVNASNNAPGIPQGAGSVSLSETGWYTIKHSFRNVNGVLAVTMTITNKATNAVAGTWTLSDPSDVIATVVGGNRYGWFPTQRFDFDHIAIDNAKLTMVNAPQPTAPQNGGTTISADKSVTFGWDAVADATSYEVQYSTNPGRTPNNVDGELNADVVTLPLTSNTSLTTANLPNGTIFWQVRAIVGSENGPWSNIWSTKVVNSVVVSPDTMNGWSTNTGISDTNTTQSGGSVAFVATPNAPLSTGALQVETNASVDARVRVAKDVNVKLSQVDSISYDAKVTAAAEDYADASFRLGLDNNNDGVVDMTVVYEPYYNGTVQQNVWQTWNVKEGKFWGSWNGGGGYDSNVTINNIPGTNADTTIRKISVGLGNYNASWRVLVDNVRFDTTVYDFEPAAPVVVPSAAFTAKPSNTAVANTGYTTEEDFTFNLTSASNTTRYEVSYWNDIEGSTFKQSTPWNSDITAYSSSLGVYNDEFTQGEGTHYFAFRSCNAINECSAYSAPFVVTYDKTAPTVNITGSTTVGNVITPTVTTNDEDVTYAWTANNQQSTDNVVVSDPTVKQPTFTVGVDGSYSFTLVTTDRAGNTDSDTFLFTYTTPVVPGDQTPASDPDGDDDDAADNAAPVAFTGVFTNGQGVLGATDNITDDTDAAQGNAAVEGATDDKTAAVDTDASDGSIFGLAWYWWLLILAALAGLAWFIIAAIRRRNEEEA